MANKPTDIGSPVKHFVSQSIKEIEAGMPKGYALTSNIDFELSVVNKQMKGGKVDLRVLSLGGDVATQNTQKVRFSVGDPKLVEQQAKKLFKILKEVGEEPKKKRKKKLK